MSDKIAQPQIARAEARLSVDIDDAKLREQGASAAAVRVEDLSRQGFRTEWPYKLKPGDRIWLTLPGIEARPAVVRWTRGFKIGAEFEQALHFAVFDHLLKRLAGARLRSRIKPLSQLPATRGKR